MMTNHSQKFGRTNEKTPAQWTSNYKDYDQNNQGSADVTMAETTSADDVLAAPSVPPTGLDPVEEADAGAEATKNKKRKSRDEDESVEDKAARKAAKKAKKEEKEKKKAEKAKRKSKGGDESEDSD